MYDALHKPEMQDTLFEAWDHTTLTHCQYEVRRFTAFELFAVYRAD
jgi:hypothetical protein